MAISDGAVDPQQVIAQLYEAVARPERWEGALLALGRWLGGADVCRMTGWDSAVQASPLFVRATESIDEPALADHEHAYFERFRPIDPRVAISGAHFMGRLGSCEEYLTRDDVQRGEFFQDFMRRKCDIRWTAGGRVYSEGSVYVDFALERVRDRPDFSSGELVKMNAVASHLRHAVAAHMQLSRYRVKANLTHEAFDVLDQGVLVIDGQLRISFANRRAERLLREADYVKVADGRVVATVRAVRQPLQSAIECAARTGRPAALRIPAQGAAGVDAPHCHVQLTRIGNAPLDGVLRAGNVHVVCLLVIPGRQRLAGAQQLMQLYGFSAAEARVARSMLTGRSPEETANDLGIRLSTVRTHIRALLSKTGARNQGTLCTLLAQLPSVRSSPDGRSS